MATENDDKFLEDLFGVEDEQEDELTPEPSKNAKVIEIPNYPQPSLDAQTFFSRLSTIFGIQQTPFHPDTYDGEDMKPITKIDEFGVKKSRQAPAHTIRWRWARNNKGERVKQSNAKLVRWSDGTLCLYVGEESYTVTQSQLKIPYLLCSKSNQALQPHASIPSRLMFQPNSKSSVSRVVQNARQDTVANPKAVVINAHIQKELKARAEALMESQRLKQMQSGTKKRKSESFSLDADFLEEGTDVAATKAAYRKRPLESLNREGSNSKRLMDIKSGNKKRKLKEYEEGSDDEDSFIASEDEEEEMPDLSDSE